VFVKRDDHDRTLADDVHTLHRLGYSQELARRMSGFSNFALSLSIICILAGGVTSFHIGFCSVGGAAIGLGWPLVCLFSLVVALTMAQVASAFPTAGGLYHWAAILGGRGWGWATAWFNLVGLVTVLAAINMGTVEFVLGAFFPDVKADNSWKVAAVLGITCSQALFNHLGIRVTTRLTDFSGYWIFAVAALLTLTLLGFASGFDLARLVTFANYSGPPAAVWPETGSILWLFALGALLPAYTLTGFDASAHTSEETVAASRNVPRGIVRSVLASGIAGWLMLVAVVLAMPDLDEAAGHGEQVFFWTLNQALPRTLAMLLFAGIAVAQYLCGLATVTSASRMAFAFARDGGLPASRVWRHVSPRFRIPARSIWLVAGAAVLFTVYTPVYSTITVVCTLFLYLSYVLPAALGFFAHGRRWKQMGPWQLGRWYRPLAVMSVLGCLGLIVIGMQPPNEKAAYAVGGACVVLTAGWYGLARKHFPGPPRGVLAIHQPHEPVPPTLAKATAEVPHVG
jgi:amino acid transporter